MCGVPVHAADDYLQKLIALGFRVAVCEQTEDPAEARRRGAKSVVRRAVTRLVTPGTITEERLLDAGRNNYLAALVRIAGERRRATGMRVAWIDISTGEFRIGECGAGGPRGAARADRAARGAGRRQAGGRAGNPRSRSAMRRGADAAAGGVLRRRHRRSSGWRRSSASRRWRRSGLSAARSSSAGGGARRLYREDADRQAPADRAAAAGPRQRDHAARRGDARESGAFPHARRRARGQPARGDRPDPHARPARGSSPSGWRARSATRRRSRSGSTLLQFFVDGRRCGRTCARRLPRVPDMLRALSRLGLDRGGPRDLDCIRAGLKRPSGSRGSCRSRRTGLAPGRAPPGLRLRPKCRSSWRGCFAAALADDLPLLKRDGGFVRQGYDAALDEARGAARRKPPGHRLAAGALRRGDRHPLAEDPAQQRARLFRRGDRRRRRRR